jgi:hypothetical protein
VEMMLGGFVMDFPRVLTIETSLDNAKWSQAWIGNVPLLTLSAALEDPRNLTLPFPILPRPARYIRFTQRGAENVYYWSVAELRIRGRK